MTTLAERDNIMYSSKPISISIPVAKCFSNYDKEFYYGQS
jgi:hypothetical protein